ncbi:uncharacterized protein F5891DRAFT_191838 [Suillus fuscotomentosus]|uniref:HIT-type domain-containing protein n=1 Tax=Suillus fuscotomentosus TaxID=1912939 RepID=A0AAD4EBJ8_9AGAM|nr:uncharacterized protein F5891DRAFT_191838 [Suillus fuscotomentosus]KAG1901923.1 hypothetical protein F5891DRAFT_191838 [Suillus fuscotomentosus]
MPPRSCHICNENESKYTCSKCRATVYCSVACYKRHKESCGSAETSAVTHEVVQPSSAEETVDDPKPLRPLTSLNWPYVPEESAYPDPLKRDDPRPLQVHQYEAIATSAAVRRVLELNPRLPELLTSIDKLRGADREDALHRALGVDTRQLKNDLLGPQELDEDTRTLRQLAEAVEAAVRGGKEGVLGLDWDE